MASSPPEHVITSPYPSISTPMPSSSQPVNKINSRPRRYTISRPDSGMALLADSSTDEYDDDNDHLESFNRISDILSNLIQEAHEAVHGHPEDINLEMFSGVSPDTLSTKSYQRNLSSSSLSSSETLFSPSTSVETTASSSTTSTSPSPSSPLSSSPIPAIATPKSCTRKVARPLSCTAIMIRHASPGQNDPLTESYKRLDSSMALVDSLSRDLVSPEPDRHVRPLESSAISVFLLLPLLHIPHTLISMVLDVLLFDTHPLRPVTDIQTLTSIFIWAFFFAITNFKVDQAVMDSSTKMNNGRYHGLTMPGNFISVPMLYIQTKPRRRCVTRRSQRKQRHTLLSGDAMRMHKTNAFAVSRSQTQQGHTPSYFDSPLAKKRRGSF